MPARRPASAPRALPKVALPTAKPLSMTQAVEISRRQVAHFTARNGATMQGLRKLYDEALSELQARMKKLRVKPQPGAPPRVTVAFSTTQAKAVRAQLQDGIDTLTRMAQGFHEEAVRAACTSGVRDTIRQVRGLEWYYRGVAAPLAVEEAAVFHGLVEGVHASILRQHPESSIRAYGMDLIETWESYLGRAVLAKTPYEEVVDRVVDAAAEPGLLSGDNYGAPTFERWRGERIVRTETLYAYNGAKQRTLEEVRDTDFPDLMKTARATFDDRTSPDSYPVDGQIRELDEDFEDGEGRLYLHPPGRPNDREVELPWRRSWAEDLDQEEAV